MAFQVENMKKTRDAMKSSLYPQYQTYQNRYASPMARGAQSLMENQWGMVTDESKRGYSDTVKNAMMGRQADALSAARGNFQKSNVRNVSAQGMGHTGQITRNMLDYDSMNAGKMRDAARDVELSDAEAKRDDYWKSVQGYGGAIGTLGQAGATSLAGTEAENQFWNNQAELMKNIGLIQLQQKQLESQGFWGTFKKGMAAGLSNTLTGGNQDINKLILG